MNLSEKWKNEAEHPNYQALLKEVQTLRAQLLSKTALGGQETFRNVDAENEKGDRRQYSNVFSS